MVAKMRNLCAHATHKCNIFTATVGRKETYYGPNMHIRVIKTGYEFLNVTTLCDGMRCY